MPLSPVVAGHLLEVKVYTYFRSQLGLNVIHMKVNTVTAGMILTDIVQQIEADWNGSWKAWMNDEAEWKGIGIRDLTHNPLEVEVFSGAQAGPGTGGDPLPGQLCGLITKRTAVAGPKGRGRMYVPFPGSDMMLGGAVDPVGGVAVLDALIADIRGPETETAGGFSMNWNVVLRTPTIGGDPFSSTPLITMVAEAEFASQRRRGNYGTKNQLPAELA